MSPDLKRGARMTRADLADHIAKQMEDSAQMGEPPSFAFEDVTDALRLVAVLRAPCLHTWVKVAKQRGLS